jgi:uncharacterized protein
MGESIIVHPGRFERCFHVVAKPIGSLCNLNCTYCYYLHKEDVLQIASANRIDEDLLEEFTRQYIEGQEVDFVVFNWLGGEPALLGLDYYRRAVEIQQKFAGNIRIENDFQTNGTLLDEQWCQFFKEHRFRVGLSIDGPKHLHDRFRVGHGGASTFDRVFRAARLLQQYEVQFNTLTVVNSFNAQYPDEIYFFLTEELGSCRLQWLPCVELKGFRTTSPARWDPTHMPVLGSDAARPGRPGSVVTDWSVDPEQWGDFLSQTFYLWLKHGLGKVIISWFESMVGQWMGEPAQICTLAEVCGRSLMAIETDGSLYSCERFVYPEYSLGNLRDGNGQLGDKAYSLRQRKFGCDKRDRLPTRCQKCRWRFACNGECPKNRFLRTPEGQFGLNYLCSGMQRFFTYAEPHFQKLVEQVRRSRGQ